MRNEEFLPLLPNDWRVPAEWAIFVMPGLFYPQMTQIAQIHTEDLIWVYLFDLWAFGFGGGQI